MKTLKNIALAALILTSTFAAQAGWVNGYTRRDGTYVSGYYRTPANGTPYDNLSYRGYPSQQPGYVSPRSYGFDSSWSRPTPLPSYGCHSYSTLPYTFSGTSTSFGGTTYHNYRSSFGDAWSGTTTRFGNTAYTTLKGW